MRDGVGARCALRFHENTMDVPHASRGGTGWAGFLPYLRHGPGAAIGRAAGRQSRTPRHDAAFLYGGCCWAFPW